MNNKKPLTICSLLLLISFVYIFNVFAHSGRTDASGGHRDNKNASGLGSYHYHCGGYPAHLHTNGVCPYKTKITSTSTSTTKSTASTTTTNNDRYKEGHSAGYNKGYGEGYESGRKNGYELGRKDGYKAGTEYKSPHDIALLIYAPISLIAILALCIKAFKK